MISIILITGSEEENIKDCLESKKWTNKVITEKLHHRILSAGPKIYQGIVLKEKIIYLVTA
ncbi:MAG: hypothetical protein IH819_05150 [Bacteroidetes bacterium]|nr:hypothetical protein [Bacteroidota bacterium]MCH9028996.1 hypothetical protein [Bacteroidota bacterium]